MATVGEYKKSLKEGYDLDKMYANKEEATKRSNEAYNNVVDTAAQNSVAVYQDSIDRAPAQALEQKGTHAVQEEINRRQTAEAMANMGLTDSGLNRSQQTAISLSRGNADAAVDRQTQEYVNQLQMAIDSVLTEAETKKAANQAASEKELQDWWAEANHQLELSANEAAATMHAADVEAQNEWEIAQLENQNKQINNGYEQLMEYITSRVSAGVDPTYALAEGNVLFGTENVGAQNYYNAYNDAKQRGYTDAEAQQIATAASQGQSVEEAEMNVMKSSGDKVDTSGWVDTGNLPNYWGRMEALDYGRTFPTASKIENSVVKQSQNWDLDDWTDVVQRATETAETKYKGQNLNLAQKTKNYIIAKAVIQAIPKGVKTKNRYLYTALVSKFGEKIVDAAMATCGWEPYEDVDLITSTTEEPKQAIAGTKTATSSGVATTKTGKKTK